MRDITVVVTNLSNRAHYYHWFIYGLMLLSKKGVIRLRFEVSPYQRIMVTSYTSWLFRLLERMRKNWLKMRGKTSEIKKNAYLRGYMTDSTGQTKKFCIDSADSPNMYSGELLKTVDIYFKTQCPKHFDRKGFPLGHVYIPYFDVEYLNPEDEQKGKGKRKTCPEVFEYNDKIKPLMTGVRKMGRTCSYHVLNSFYKNMLKSRREEKTQKAMCYFGNAKGPVPTECVKAPDYDWEADIMGYYGDQLHHPNEKRTVIGNILQSLGNGYDSRIIRNGHADSHKGKKERSLVVPLKYFSRHVAHFQYNINVSGFRMSIPSRFIDSFVCGTAIATDNLYVKWYHPFGKEVTEIGEMGYLPNQEVGYEAIKETITKLPPADKELIISNYEKWWSPEACARYMVDTVIGNNYHHT